MKIKILVLMVLVGFFLWPLDSAEACSTVGCQPDLTFFPRSELISKDVKSILVDLGSFEEIPKITLIDADTKEAIEFTYEDNKVTPINGFEVGKKYTISTKYDPTKPIELSFCNATYTFEVRDAVLPDSIQLSANEGKKGNYPTDHLACYDAEGFGSFVRILFDSGAYTWAIAKDSLIIEFLVDGKHWNRRVIYSTGEPTVYTDFNSSEEMIYAFCHGEDKAYHNNIEPGIHQVKAVLTLPGNDEWKLETEEISVDLSLDSSCNHVENIDGGVDIDGGVGVTADGGGGLIVDKDDGCSLSSKNNASFLAFVFLAILMASRKRRRV